MKLREYQAKSIFARNGILTPTGDITDNADAAAGIAMFLDCPVILKPQLGVKGRGKAGGIAIADTPEQARNEAQRLLSLTVKGEKVRTILVEQRVPVAKELYIAVTVDYGARQPVMIASSEGGVDIEDAAEKHPGSVLRIPVNILRGPDEADLKNAAGLIGNDAAGFLRLLYTVFRKYDAEMVEINPLIRTTDNVVIAADAVLNVNEDSVFRHEDLLEFKKDIPVEDPIAEEASQNSWTYIDLPGDIGILSSGAGLTMAIMDLIHHEGGSPANFLDTAQIDEAGMYRAFELLARAKQTKAMLVNMFAGLNRCDSLAAGIRRYVRDHPPNIPLVVRMVGNREEDGRKILDEIGIEAFSRLEDAVSRVVKLVKTKK